ncbi:MAG: 3-deoxy-D-manno-octulosonic acid transferase [Ignavibacteriales bacterium]|nr:3-deoxy-D-manno-octulosonic acid transferase [Ignavibacteriales bacterium]
MMIWKILYNVCIIPLLWCGFHLYGLLNQKARRALRGRKNLFGRLQQELAHLESVKNRIWFHASSMGEFEQAKPIIAELKKRYPEIQVIVSFFSPSGYEHSLSYKLADVVTYIPFDSYFNAKKFIEIVKPSAAILVRYDIWPNHIWILKQRGIPAFIASATLQVKTYRKVPLLRQFIRSLYNSFDYILTVSETDKNVFETFHLNHPVVKVIGDTRYDQVWKRSAESRKRQLLDPKLLENKKVVVVGSSWREDETRLLPAISKLIREIENLLIIWVQHEPTEENLEYLEIEISGNIPAIRFSHLHQYQNEKIILVDSVGILMTLYQYAHAAYVGGGFGSGIHNVLEPASYGIPILFGPKFTNSQEATRLLNEEAAYMGRSEDELYYGLSILLTDESQRKRCGEKAIALVNQNVGATERVLFYIEKVL